MTKEEKCCLLQGSGQCGCEHDALIVPRHIFVALMDALTDEGGDWSNDGLQKLRVESAMVFTRELCPDWLIHFRND